MSNDQDALAELRRQLGVVRRRIGETVRQLAEAEAGLTADGLEGMEAAAWAEGKGDLFQLCVRLEVALAESTESACKLTRRLRGLTGDAGGLPWLDGQCEQSQPGGWTFGWHN
jgi:hypothetical protein